MYSTAAATTTAKTVNVLAASATPTVGGPIARTTPCSLPKPNMLSPHACRKPFCTISLNSGQRACGLLLGRCSTKPGTDTDSARDQSSPVEPTGDSNLQQQAKPSSDEAFCASPSSSASSSSFSAGLVFDLGLTGSWDSAEVGSPVVKRFLSDDEERWYMWYCGSSDKNRGLDSIGLAVSSNGVHWERGGGRIGSSGDVGLVMNCGKDWWGFDTRGIRPSEVVVMSSTKVRASSAVYWLYYAGYSSEKVRILENSIEFPLENPERVCINDVNDESDGIGKVFKSLPGLAISQDGRHWARIEGEHHSGALFDVGSGGEWDSTFIAAPQVVFHSNGDLRMYYHSFDVENGHFAVGIARSRDGLRWVKLGKVLGGGACGSFDEFGAANAQVVRSRKDGNYVMVYEGIAADGGRSIGLAVSPDGLKDWRRFHDKAILKPSTEDGWDCKGVGSPCLVQMNGDADEWRLYYRGIGNGGRTGIGMAVSEGNEVRSLRRWTGFHL